MVNCVRLVLVIAGTPQAAFLAPPGPTVAQAGTKLNFGFNGLGSPPDDGKEDAEKPEKKITARGLIQLITAGMGAPFLGDYQGVDSVSASILFWCFVSNDIHMRSYVLIIAPCSSATFPLVGFLQDGKMMFTLEANNLVDENGNSKQTQMPYFENGWVEEKDESEVNSGGGFKFPWQK